MGSDFEGECAINCWQEEAWSYKTICGFSKLALRHILVYKRLLIVDQVSHGMECLHALMLSGVN